MITTLDKAKLKKNLSKTWRKVTLKLKDYPSNLGYDVLADFIRGEVNTAILLSGSEDAVEVIRCKDCVCWSKCDCYCVYHDDVFPEDGFCSKATKE